jgi:flavin reductase (DIM6/NTAB) family NADH-FMN oxidoreductase RutF
MMEFNARSIADLAKNTRTNLINSLTGFKSANLVGTANSSGQTNLAVVNSVVHIGAHPPLNGIIFRPDSVPRHTLDNILETGSYTLNHIHQGIFRSAHQTAARYPRDVSEFDAVGLTPGFRQDFPAPLVQEAYVRIGMAYREHHRLAINDTLLLIGEVVWIQLPESVLKADGFLDLETAGTLAISGLDSYHSTSRLARMAYAKPDKPPAELKE